jgi:hypothetical protein
MLMMQLNLLFPQAQIQVIKLSNYATRNKSVILHFIYIYIYIYILFNTQLKFPHLFVE